MYIFRVGNALRHTEELHNIIIEGIVEGKKIAGRSRNSYVGKIKIHKTHKSRNL